MFGGFPRSIKPVECIYPRTGAAIGAGDYVSCKNAHRVWIIIQAYYGNATDCIVTLREATAVAGTDVATVTNYPKMWVNTSTAAGDTFTAVTPASTYTFNFDTAATQTNHILIMEWDCTKFQAGFDCLNLSFGNSNAGNLFSALYLMEMREGGADDAVITD